MSRSYDQACPIARTLDLVGDRWTLLIVRDLFFGRSRFKELLEHSPGMPTKMLADRLKALEAHGFVERRVYSDHPLRADYHLTARGMSLKPVMEAIVVWGMDQTMTTAERDAVAAKIDARVVAANAPFPLLTTGAPARRATRPYRPDGSPSEAPQGTQEARD